MHGTVFPYIKEHYHATSNPLPNRYGVDTLSVSRCSSAVNIGPDNTLPRNESNRKRTIIFCMNNVYESKFANILTPRNVFCPINLTSK